MNDEIDAGALALELASASEDDRDRLVEGVLARTARAAGVHRAYVTVFLGDTFETSHEWTAGGIPRHGPVIQNFPSASYAYSVGLAMAGEVLDCPDLSLLPSAAAAERRSFEAFGVRAVLQVPIVHGGMTVGLVGLNDFTPRSAWPVRLVEQLRSIGTALGIGLAERLIAHRTRDEAHAQRVPAAIAERLGHELRTPLHAILGFAELLELDRRNDADREALLQIQFNGRRLVAHLEDLVELGDVPGDRSVELDLGDAIAAVVAAVGADARARGLGDPEVNVVGAPTVWASPGRLRQVLHCALSGAIHLATSGAIRLRATPSAAESGAVVELSFVTDRGTDQVDQALQLTGALCTGIGRLGAAAPLDDRLVVVIDFAQVASP